MLATAYAVHDRYRRSTSEGRRPRAGEGDRRGPGVHVGGGGRVVAVEDLGSEVAGRAEQPAGVGQLGVVGHPREPEVDEDGGAALHQHVGRLHVPVQDALLVHGEQRLPQARGEPDEVVTGDRPLLAHVVVEREARHVARGDVRDVVPRVGVDDLRHAWVPDPGQRAHLAGQPLPGLVVADDVRAQHLQRHPGTARALRQVYDAHAALADARQQSVAPHRETWRRTCLLGTRRGRHAVECTREHPGERRPMPSQAMPDRAGDLVRSGWSGPAFVRRTVRARVSRPGASSRRCRRRGRTGCRPAPGGSAP